jgi:hypothetical protein
MLCRGSHWLTSAWELGAPVKQDADLKTRLWVRLWPPFLELDAVSFQLTKGGETFAALAEGCFSGNAPIRTGAWREKLMQLFRLQWSLVMLAEITANQHIGGKREAQGSGKSWRCSLIVVRSI